MWTAGRPWTMAADIETSHRSVTRLYRTTAHIVRRDVLFPPHRGGSNEPPQRPALPRSSGLSSTAARAVDGAINSFTDGLPSVPFKLSRIHYM
jgi:hypothetical protein